VQKTLCLLRWDIGAPAWSSQETPTPPPASWRREGSPGDPLATPRDAPLLSSFPWRPPSSPCFLPVTCKQCHGRHLAPPIPCSPLLPNVLSRCTSPPSTSPSKELARSASNRRRHRGYLAREPSSPPPNCSPPNRTHRRTQGGPPVLLDPFPFFLSRQSAAPPWSLAGARHGCGRPGHHTSVACWWASGPPS
jgi:hypothetical protein